MVDIRSSAATPQVIRREDYRPPDWLVPDVALNFMLDPAATRVNARLDVRRNGSHSRPLHLDGDGLVPLSVRIDGEAAADSWRLDGGALVIDLPGDAHVIETEVEIAPITEAVTIAASPPSRAAITASTCSCVGLPYLE